MAKEKKKTKIPSYLKKKLKGVTIGGSAGVDDSAYVTQPRGSLSITKGKTTLTGGASKPFSKFDKKNMNSELSLGVTRSFKDDSGGVSLSGNKSGKNKGLTLSFEKKFSKGGEAKTRGMGCAIRGGKFEGVF